MFIVNNMRITFNGNDTIHRGLATSKTQNLTGARVRTHYFISNIYLFNGFNRTVEH